MEVTHCNIITMAIKSESAVERGAERGGRARMSKGRSGRRDFQQQEGDVRLFSLWNADWTCGRAAAFHVEHKVASLRVFLSCCFIPLFHISRPVLLFLHLLQLIFLFGRSGPVSPQVSQECFSYCHFALTRTARMFEHAKVAR